jgi:hypothetical protein
MAAFDASGRPVLSARVRADGSVDLLTVEPEDEHPANDDASWVDLAGETDSQRAKRA